MNRLTLFAVATAAAAGITLTGCSSSSSGTGHSPMSSSMPMSAGSTSTPAGRAAAAGPHDQADVTFATDMIPHHEQAIEMSAMAASQATNARVMSLAAAIKSAQGPEVATMTGWLKSWGQPAPSSMSGMDMGGGTGMMSTADMAKLRNATGAAFDRMWVQMMIEHHQGAVTMAKTELAHGANTDAKRLADSIVTSQTSQIVQLNALLATLPS